jgi:hypothetical protein
MGRPADGPLPLAGDTVLKDSVRLETDSILVALCLKKIIDVG